MNNDYKVTKDGALLVEQYLVGLISLTKDQLIQADVTLDNAVTAKESMVIKQIHNHLRSLPPGPSSETLYYFINDHLGTPLALTDASGVKVWEADYLPFGKIYMETGTQSQDFRFPGQYFDGETGLHYSWHRYYDPTMGRYLTPDPIGIEGGINQYIYSLNNPINYIDPKGLFTIVGNCHGNKDKMQIDIQNACDNSVEDICDDKLKMCIKERCKSGKINCTSKEKGSNEMGWNLWYFGCIPSKEINVVADHPNAQNKFGKIAIHEWAHSCGWSHGDGGGVPGDNGKL